MKKFLASFVAVVMIVGVMSSVMAVGATAGISGQFTGSAPGFNGPIEVQITVANGVITEIEYLEFHDTLVLVDVAMYRILEHIVEFQSLSVDFVTGVTMTSFGIIAAVADAAAVAGLDVAQLRRNPANIEPRGDIVMETDVLVLGAGGAGFAAAIEAAHEGADVIIFEKASVIGGNTLTAGGAYNAVNPAVHDNLILTGAQYDTLNGILALDVTDEALGFHMFPEWASVLLAVQGDIEAHFAAHEGTEVGVDMPSFDSINLHMWHTYIGGLRQLLDGDWIAGDYDLVRIMVEGSLEAFMWLNHETGMTANYTPENLTTVLGGLWRRNHGFATGRARMYPLRDRAVELGAALYLDVRATELITDGNGAVIGARAVDMVDGTNITVYTSRGVILATGGFGDNAAMAVEFDNYWGEHLTPRTLSTNSGTLMGDGIIMAQAVGAALTADMGAVQMITNTSPAKGILADGVWGSAEQQIKLDGDGNRFVNEYAERDVISKAALALPGAVYYIISAGPSIEPGNHMAPHRGAAPYGPAAFGGRVENLIERSYIWWAPTLEELAAATANPAKGVAPAFTYEALRATLERYNEIVMNQYDPDFGKGTIGGYIDIDYINADPSVGFIISPRTASIHHTMGGIQIDTETRVINTDGEIIPGLWAAGEVTGGIHAGNRLGGNAHADIFVFGRIAGYNAANGR